MKTDNMKLVVRDHFRNLSETEVEISPKDFLERKDLIHLCGGESVLKVPKIDDKRTDYIGVSKREAEQTIKSILRKKFVESGPKKGPDNGVRGIQETSRPDS